LLRRPFESSVCTRFTDDAWPAAIPEVISGHTTEGAPSSRPHIAIVPLANVGWEHATGGLLGFAVVLPRRIESADRRAALQALARFAHLDEGDDGCGDVRLWRSTAWRVARVASPSRASLKPTRWCARSLTWASATPLLLDRFPDYNDPIEEAHLIANACRNIELPEPSAIEIQKLFCGSQCALCPSCPRQSFDSGLEFSVKRQVREPPAPPCSCDSPHLSKGRC
jgi:CRISPR-associated protein Csb2